MAVYEKVQRSLLGKCCLPSRGIALTQAVCIGGKDPASKVVDVDGSDPTRDTYQRKVFFDGTTFFIVYWDLGDKKVYFVASVDGETWSSKAELWAFSVAPYYGGNIHIGYPNRGATDLGGQPYDFSIVFGGSTGLLNWNAMTILGQVLNDLSRTQLSGTWQGGSTVANFDATYDIWVFHRSAFLSCGTYASERATSTDVSYGGATTGGCQILTYKTSSPYDLFVLAKGGDDKLYYNTVASFGNPYRASFIEIATLGTGFSDFCGCSEAQNVGDPEKVHLVYIKSTGELCYRKFEGDVLGGETVLVESGASYPVIACGASGRLYVFYVKAGKIMMRKYDGSWLAQEQPFPGHSYHTPTYLSSNQNVQDGKICLVWTEGTETPWEVWFCSLHDA